MSPEQPLNLEPESQKEKASDRELADFLIKHIKHPCEVEVASGVKENIRKFYIDLAKEEIHKMTDPEAVKDLENEIKNY